MSTKTIVEQLAEAQGAIAALTTERDALKASVESFASQKADLEKAGEGFRQSLADAIAKADATAADLAAKLEAESAAKSTAEKAQAETAAELAKLKAHVASNPAFADAASKGAKPVADVGASGSEDLVKALEKITDPTERAKFRAANYGAIMAQIRTTRKG